jgi:hypothetical protein
MANDITTRVQLIFRLRSDSLQLFDEWESGRSRLTVTMAISDGRRNSGLCLVTFRFTRTANPYARDKRVIL